MESFELVGATAAVVKGVGMMSTGLGVRMAVAAGESK